MKKAYLVIYEKGRRNYSGFAPDVLGCGSVGKTLEDMRANMKEALEGYMEVSAEYGDQLPEPQTRTVTLPIAGELDPKTTYVVEFLTIQMPKVRATQSGSKTGRSKQKPSRELVAA